MLQINNIQTVKKSARALEKFLAKSGIDFSHGKALDALSVLAGYQGWNSLAYALSPEGINAQLHDFELSHIKGSQDADYGAECALVAHTGFELRYSATDDLVDYVRVCDPAGRELAYWNSDEWMEDPQVVMGAILGALVRGRPVEYSENKKRTVQPQKVVVPEVKIQDVPLSYCSGVLLNGVPYEVSFREDRIIDKLEEPAGDPDYESDSYHVAMTLFREEDGLEFLDEITLHTLRTLTWNPVKECFVSPDGDLYEFFIEYKFKPGMTVIPEQEVSSTSAKASNSATQPEITTLGIEDNSAGPSLYEVTVFALADSGVKEKVGTWLGSAINPFWAENQAITAVWTPEWNAKGSRYAEVKPADEAHYGPFKVYLDGALYAEVPYFSMAVSTADVMLEVADTCTVTSFGGKLLHKIEK